MLDDLNLGELHTNRNKWLDSWFGDKNKQGTTNVIPTGDITNANHFTHTNILYITFMLSAVASGMWAMEFLVEAKSFFKHCVQH